MSGVKDSRHQPVTTARPDELSIRRAAQALYEKDREPDGACAWAEADPSEQEYFCGLVELVIGNLRETTASVSSYTIRRNIQGHAEAIERDGYTVLLLAVGAERNEQEVERIVEALNGRGLGASALAGAC